MICFNPESERVYKGFPELLRRTIEVTQKAIETEVKKVFPSAVSTSGFRSPAYNSEIGGKENSLHIWGFARDFKMDSKFPKSIPGFKIIFEGDHIHVSIA